MQAFSGVRKGRPYREGEGAGKRGVRCNSPRLRSGTAQRCRGRMNQETVIYMTNIVIGAILAALLTHSWWRRRTEGAMTYWALAAWVMTVADVLFAARPIMPHAVGRLLPTLCVTLGHVVLLLGAEQTARMQPRWRLMGAIVAVHAIGLVGFLFMPELASWRMVMNGVIWCACSLVSAAALRRGSRHFWQSAAAPATAFVVHGAFHGLRVVLAAGFATKGWREAAQVLEIVGDLEVSFFMVALFVGLLVAQLQLRYEELMTARAEVTTLSGLLPICAWCKKVRDDDGYWEQVEEYFSKRSQLRFTHGMCTDCQGQMRATAVKKKETKTEAERAEKT